MIDTATLDRLAELKTALAQRPLRPEARHALDDDGRRWPLRVADCERKTAFTSRFAAEHRLHKLTQQILAGVRETRETRPIRVYRCIVCAHWHLTGVPER